MGLGYNQTSFKNACMHFYSQSIWYCATYFPILVFCALVNVSLRLSTFCLFNLV